MSSVPDSVHMRKRMIDWLLSSINEMVYVVDSLTYEILFINKALEDKQGKKLLGVSVIGICLV